MTASDEQMPFLNQLSVIPKAVELLALKNNPL
jgi:hypothetical protein